ncbi:MAG: T9SS type A sorting domain-containing protein [Paludibacter sp.]|nr:T9SS type A sorting domain-containing protein [Paludibacter sp.]
MKHLSTLCLAMALTAFSVTVYADNVTVPAGKTTVESYTDSQVTVADGGDLHITSATPLTGSTVNLATNNAWLMFENIRPSVVLSNWLQYVKVNNAQAVNGTNVRVEVYVQGTVIIPTPSGFSPLQAFDGINFTGNIQQYDVNYHKTLGTMDNAIRSFKLKRGYMATLATYSNGRGFSRVFIADNADLEVSQLQPELDQTVSFIRVLAWHYPSVKGVCGSNDGYVQLTQSTWWNNWGGGSNSQTNYEYVPMWNKLNGSWSSINSRTNVTHLLGLNEPDHPEQHKDDNGEQVVTVARAIQEWPLMFESGLRIGSPACTDESWIYNFIDECDRLNYRVDFVAWHAYWGGKSPQSWYNDLKRISDRCGGRPIWITEWNNGANWTNEGGWERNTSSSASPKPLLDNEANRQKQLRDITAILQVLDTASFVERQSLYNWVETARMIATNSDNNNRALTPAGVYYRDDKSSMAFKRHKEYIPTWHLNAPAIPSHSIVDNNTNLQLNLTSSVYNELITSYIVEEKIGTSAFSTIATLSNIPIVSKLTIPVNTTQQGIHSYRIRSVDRAGHISEPSSEIVFAVSPNSSIQFDVVEMSTTDWTTLFLGQTFTAAPAAILGTATSNNVSLLMSQRIQSLTGNQLKFRLQPWNYITATLVRQEKLPYLILPSGTYNFGGLNAVAGKTTANGTWQTVNFAVSDGYFSAPPVVIPTQVTTLSATATSVHIRNVTATGFEICLRHEAAQTYSMPTETISYIAISEGSGIIEGKKIYTGKIENVGHVTRLMGTFTWTDSIENPLLFCYKQTANNIYASSLRINSFTALQAKVLNQIERSGTVENDPATDTVGWMVIEGAALPTGIDVITSSASKFVICPNPVSDVLHFKNKDNENVKIGIYNLQGMLVKSASGKISQISVTDLTSGLYLVNINGESTKILKK